MAFSRVLVVGTFHEGSNSYRTAKDQATFWEALILDYHTAAAVNASVEVANSN